MHVEGIAGRWRRRQRPRVHRSLRLTGLSSTTSSCCWAALASILAAPILLWCTPPRHPVGEACVAIVGSRSSGGGRSATGTLSWAALAMHPAAPLFLAHRPSHHPIGETISAIVWVGRRTRCDGYCRKRHRHWHWWRDWLRAANMVDPAAPRLLVCLPHGWRVHRTIEGVDWTDRPGWRHRALRLRTRWRLWRRWWGCGWWGRWRSGLRSCWCRLGGATDSACTAAILLLCWRPHRCCCRDICAN